MDHPFQIIFIIVTTIYFITAVLWPNHGKGLVYFPDVPPQFTNVNISARGNFSVDEVYEITNKVEKEILGVEEVKPFISEQVLEEGI